MSYPIRFKVVSKTGRVLTKDECPMLAPNGNLAIKLDAFYMGLTFQPCSDWELWVALDKVNGQWDYKKVGY